MVVLLGKNGCRHKIDDLLSFLYCLKCSSKSYLCLSIANIATHQAVHNLSRFHIVFYIGNGIFLIRRLFKGKHLLKFLLPLAILGIKMSTPRFSGCIEHHQLLGNIFYCCLYSLLCLFPLSSTEFVELWHFGLSSCKLLNEIKFCCWNITTIFTRILNFNVIPNNMVSFNLFNSSVNTKPMIFVYHIVANRQFTQRTNSTSLMPALLLSPLSLLPPKEIAFR